MSSIHELLQQAVASGASDVHITAGQRPIIRVDGRLIETEFEPLTAEDTTLVVQELAPAHVHQTLLELRECDFSHVEEGVGRFRVNIFYGKGLPALAMRYVKSEIPTLEDINLPPSLERCSEMGSGIVILSGTTSSGKSTTLAALIGLINRKFNYRIITIEDPIEYEFHDIRATITQREVGLDTRSFASGLRQVLRQDPDVILIGEIRDSESLRIGIAAAETGHLVFTTLHAGTSAQAVPRLLNEFPVDEQDRVRLALAANLRAVICQRLLPMPNGGVIPAVELLFNTPMVRKLIASNQLEKLTMAIETGGEEGMQSFDQAVYTLVKQGLVTERIGMEFATNPEKLRMRLDGIFLSEEHHILG